MTTIQSPLSVATDGYLATGAFRPLAVMSNGYLVLAVIVEPPVQPPTTGGGGIYGQSRGGTAYIIEADRIRQLNTDDEDMLTLFMLCTMYGLFED